MSFKVESSRDLGPQFVNNAHKMVGQDGAYSIAINGRTLWFFGDTLIGKRPVGSLWYIDGQPVGGLDMSGKGTISKMITNTGLLLNETSGQKGLNDFEYILDSNKNLKNLVPLLPGEDHDKIRIWCQHGISIESDIYLSFIKVEMFDKPKSYLPVEFEIIGSGFAKGSADTWEFKRLEHQGNDIWWGKENPRFASAMMKEENWIYCYGVKQLKNKEQNCYLSRVKVENIEDLNSYEYLVSEDPVWHKDCSKALSLFTDIPNELSVAFNSYLNQYLAIHSLGLSGKIVARTADKPWGPWSKPATLHQVNPEHKTPLPYPKLIYAGKEHPELSDDNGKTLYITYIEFEEYFPHLLEITLEKKK